MAEQTEEVVEGDVAESDARLLFIFNYLSKTIRFKVEKWHKMMGTEDYKNIVMEFMNTPGCDKLIVQLSSNGYLVPFNSFPVANKSKSSYFVKKLPEVVTPQNMRKILIFGDLSPKPIDELAVLVEEVLVPILTTPRNHKGWPQPIIEDVKRKVNELKDVVYRVKGQVYGQTLLPLPIGVNKVFEEEKSIIDSGGKYVDMDLKGAIEGEVIKWAGQISDVIRETSAIIFEKEPNPTPSAELRYWDARLRNIESIYNQLRDPRVKTMASILQLTDSAYFPCFKTLFGNVVGALREAREINKYLKTLEKYFEAIENIEFSDVDEIFSPLLRTISLIWVYCPFYCSSSKLINLMKEICNELVQECNKFLDPPSIFQGEVDETLQKISRALKNLKLFKKAFILAQDELPNVYPPDREPIPWAFHPKLIFEEKYEKYIARLILIEEIFLTSSEYLKLEKVEIGGFNARVYSVKLNDILEEFSGLIAAFRNISYNAADIQDDSFYEDYSNFKSKILDLDKRLAAIVGVSFDDCYNFEAVFKMINLFSSLLERPILNEEIQPRFAKIPVMFDEEVNIEKEIFDEQMKVYRETGKMDVALNWPPVAGTLQWINSMRERLSFPLENINGFEHPVMESDEVKKSKEKAQELLRFLGELEVEVFNNWTLTIPAEIKENLLKSLLSVRDDSLLELNFDEGLVAALREVRYMKLLGVGNIPQDVVDLYARDEEFFVWNTTLRKSIEWYNSLRTRCREQEFDIITDEIVGIDELVSQIISNLNWVSEGAWESIERLKELVWALYQRLNKAQDNLDKIIRLMNTWNFIPLYNRPEGKNHELLLHDDLELINKRYDETVNAGKAIYKLIAINFHLLHNFTPPCLSDNDSKGSFQEEEEKEEKKFGLGEEEEEEDEDEEEGFLKREGTEEHSEEVGTKDKETITGETTEGEDLTSLISIEPESLDPCLANGVSQGDAEAKMEDNKEANGSASTKFIDSLMIMKELGEEMEGKKELTVEAAQPEKIPLNTERPSKCAQCLSDQWQTSILPEGSEGLPKIIPEFPSEFGILPFRKVSEKDGKEIKGKHKGLKASIKAKFKSKKKSPNEAKEKKIKDEENEKLLNLSKPLEIIPPLFLEEFVNNSMKMERWERYLDLVDDLVEEGLLHAVAASIGLFIDQMQPTMKNPPLFELKMKLEDPCITFEPNLEENPDDPTSLYGLMNQIINDINSLGLLIPRISISKRRIPYRDAIIEQEEILSMETDVLNRCQVGITKAQEFAQPYNKYSYLWIEDKLEHLRQFLKFSRILDAAELEIEAREDEFDAPALEECPPTLDKFKEMIDSYENLYKELEKIIDEEIIDSWLKIDLSLFKQSLLNLSCKWGNLYKQYLIDDVIFRLRELEEFIAEAQVGLLKPLVKGDYDGLVTIMGYLLKIRDRQIETDNMFEPIKEVMDLVKSYGMDFTEETYRLLNELPEKWNLLKKISLQVRTSSQPLVQAECTTIKQKLILFEFQQTIYSDKFKTGVLFGWNCVDPYYELNKSSEEVAALENIMARLTEQAILFEINVPDFKLTKQLRKELRMLKDLWDFIGVVLSCIKDWEETQWKKIDSESMDMELKRFAKDIRVMDKDMRSWDLYIQLEMVVKNMITALRAITELQNPAIRDRHWIQLMEATKVKFIINETTTLKDLLNLKLYKCEDEVKTIVDKSVKEQAMEKTLSELQNTWSTMEFEYDTHSRTGCQVLKVSEELVEILEENQVQLQNMMTSKFVTYFYDEVSEWQRKLSNADQVIQTWLEVQRTWMYLESIFIGSDDIRKQLPEDSNTFDKIDEKFRNTSQGFSYLQELLSDVAEIPNVINATNRPNLMEILESLQTDLVKCEKALAQYLETKRLAYPRFYFVSSADLLDILSNGNQPQLVCKHLTKLYDSIARLKFVEEDGKLTSVAKGMWAKDSEYVELSVDCNCTGQVEAWLNNVTGAMRKTGHHYFAEAVSSYDDKPREAWVFDYPAQTALCGTQIWWASEVSSSFERLEEGYEYALKDYQKKQISQLNNLIMLLLSDLSVGDREKVCTICTVDVHSRDVVAKLIHQKVETSAAFQWQSQLRHRWDTKEDDCFVNICDAQFRYDYEYLGNTPRLVITPLTDRCYITLTQSLHLVMGGAPAGPAGTGKTETTKDLGKALGMMVYVFNCSEQMDYKSCGNIYKGLAQTGAWGCFDEFNRISVEVLSVVAVQVKTVLDAIKAKKKVFNFMGETISLIPSVGMFITMNPGYAGRAELPENLKALFRPCAMVVPDIDLICEIMLISAGFQDARMLARKFITLYSLCRELLSKQDHYDWGLRAVKSVLVVAGALRRSDRLRPEDQVLMRALRDFNIPKIVTDDMSIFMGLIGDLFPALEVPRKRDLEFEKLIKEAALDMKLQPEDNFILKIVQLDELFEVRHSVFIIGIAGTGKTCVWKTLFKTYINMKKKPYYNDLEPKAVTNNELFGAINPSTREWKDGLFSNLIRDQANMPGDSPKWMVMDGDIDPMWIESLNTVMDDNKVLTLASNERIALTPSMRLLFEISNLRTATPATVSRAGILNINPSDLGWNPYILSWVETRPENERPTLLVLFDKYVPQALEACRTKIKKITPVADIAHVQMLCTLLEVLLVSSNVPPECPREWYEMYFVFAAIWAFGSSAYQDQLVDWRCEFTRWWINEFKSIKFPSAVTTPTGQVFDYYVDQETKKFLPWSNKVPCFDLDLDIPLQQTLVNTTETTRLRYFLDLLIPQRKPIMLVGGAGSGKTVLINDTMTNLPDKYSVTNISFNFYTSSEMLQKVLEKPLEKKAGRNFGPPGNKVMIYFIDDMNMPEIDPYGTVQPHTLIRQYLDYQHWYDRVKLTLKDIRNISFVSCMNPTSGSFTIDSRLQRHFMVFALSFPGPEALQHIYSSMLSQHICGHGTKFLPSVLRLVDKIIEVALSMHGRMQQQFLPTAFKFHYIFNLRDLSNLFQTILLTTPECISSPGKFIRLYMHEAMRVYGDKMIDHKDIDSSNKLLLDCIKKTFPDTQETEYTFNPLIFCHFVDGIGDPKYLQISSWTELNTILLGAMSQYNDLVGTMNLVFFEDAMSHICRINRIMESPRGNALLVGVGGSGKQSLSRLSAFISGLDPFQIQLRKGYAILDLKVDLASLYTKAGVKNMAVMHLMTDSQVPEEKFLVLINDMLSSGEIPDLFPDDEVDSMMNSISTEVKGVGLQDTKENCWRFFIDRARKNIKTILCFSPVGATLRVRARKFPAIVNCTTIDWFMDWPQTALESVSARFLQGIETLPAHLGPPVSLVMAFMHTSVNTVSQKFLQNERRYNYTTAKSFLELINLYSRLLTGKSNEIIGKVERLQNGLEKLIGCSAQVDGLKEQLAVQGKIVAQKNEAAGELITVVSKEQEKVAIEKNIAADEERKVRIIEEDVCLKQKVCEEDLQKAEPALEAAQHALNTLNKTNLTELKSFGTPPDAVQIVTAAVLVLLAKKGKLPKDRSWKAAKVMMGSVDAFLHALIHYDKENIHPDIVKGIQPYLQDPNFVPEVVISKSSAAAGLCAWVINIMKFWDVWTVVLPKRNALAAANSELAQARQKLAELNEKIGRLEGELRILTDRFEQAVQEKLACEAEAEKTAEAIDLANRLVNGLASENVRWRETVENLQKQSTTLPGDILLVTAFISYVGSFTKPYREDLVYTYWVPQFAQVKPEIPYTQGIDPMKMLTDDAQIAAWNNEGLPNDRMSAENATILTNSERWPLIIDPQLQGIKWIKQKYGDNLRVIRLGQKNYLEKIENAVSDGSVLLIENIGESVDPVLDNLLGRNLIRKGRVMKIGEKEIDYSPKFRLILHTKLANPHYKPEMQAQTTLINFTVTRDGLEEQLLAEVVKVERPDLEKMRANLTKQQNLFKITLKSLEDELLHRLSSAGPNILSDRKLVENLEGTKKTAADIEVKVGEAKITSQKIDVAREIYRSVAARASLVYFILNDLHKINPMYQFSLKAFNMVFQKAMELTPKAETVENRVMNLIDSITFQSSIYTSRGLFESDKLIFMAQLVIQIFLANGEISSAELDFLLRFPYIPNACSPFDFLSNILWGGVKTLSCMDEFRNLDKDIEGSSKRWKKFIEGECPEKDKFPQDWKNKTPLQRLCLMRTLRPDRMTYAVKYFIEEKIGSKYTEARTVEFMKTYEESSATVPVFFILSPGVDPTRDVEKAGKKLGFTNNRKNLHNISLGQGQELIAEKAMDTASKHGHWVILQNIHLVANWLPTLDKKMEAIQEDPHPNYRLYLSSEPALDPSLHCIPQGVLDSSIKVTNEPPTGMMANLHKALDNFNQDTLEICSKEAEFKAILFSLCYFHAVVAERRKFGAQGWNRVYPFNVGDLTISVSVLYNYLENNSKVPWEDLRYLFGEIMYGGHITDDWDRRLCRTYLQEYMTSELVEGDLFFAPGFQTPPNSDYVGYHKYIDGVLPPESPSLYGLHPNAEIGFLTALADNLFKTILELQPRDTGEQTSRGITREEKVKQMVDEILDKLPEEFNINELIARVEDRTPYIVVAFQECERMNILMREVRKSLKELALGLKGELTITNDMEELEEAVFMDLIPANWARRAYPSMLGLSAWFSDLQLRLKELESWVGDFLLPATIWLAGLFNPQSFLTAIMQSTARRNEWPLDKMCLHCDVTRKVKEDFSAPPREGAYISGLFMEGARWESALGIIIESQLKELFPVMPVIHIRAITQDKQELRSIYECPVYKTRQRGPTYVWTFNLKTKERPAKWILAGVAILLSV